MSCQVRFSLGPVGPAGGARDFSRDKVLLGPAGRATPTVAGDELDIRVNSISLFNRPLIPLMGKGGD